MTDTSRRALRESRGGAAPARRGLTGGRGPRGRSGALATRLGAVVVVLLAVAVIVALAAAVMQARAEGVSASRDVGGFTAPPIVRATPSSATTAAIAVIGDDLSARTSSNAGISWTATSARLLKESFSDLAAAGAGYTVSPAGGAARTFADQALLVPPRAEVVVVFGGANDAGKPALTVLTAVAKTIADAKATAPDAEVVVVGPAWPGSDAPATVTGVTATLRTAARLAGVAFVDPIGQQWLQGGGLVATDGVTLTRSGQAAIARRMNTVIRQAS